MKIITKKKFKAMKKLIKGLEKENAALRSELSIAQSQLLYGQNSGIDKIIKNRMMDPSWVCDTR